MDWGMAFLNPMQEPVRIKNTGLKNRYVDRYRGH